MSKKRLRNAQIVSAPGPLTLTLGDRTETFLVRPPTPADLLSVQRWVRANVRPGATEPQGISSDELAGLAPEDRLIVLREYATAKAGRRELTQSEMLEGLQSPAGCSYMIWLSARPQHPNLRLEEVRSFISDANVDQVLADFDDAAGIENDDPKAAGSGSVSPTTPTTLPPG